jgi:hypothetical protein
MVQVRVHEMPPVVTESPVKPNQIRDASGRVITLLELDPVQESRLTVAVGPEMAINVMYMNMYAFPAAAVADSVSIVYTDALTGTPETLHFDVAR